MEINIKRLLANVPIRILFVLTLLLGGLVNIFAYNRTFDLNVGDEFTVYTTHHTYTNAVLWSYDYKIVQPVSYIGSKTTSVTFRCVAPSPSVGSVIQATTYYQRNNSSSSGTNKDVDNWKVNVRDNSTVSLSWNSLSLNPGSSEYLRATPSRSSYSGSYRWSSSNSNVAYVSGSGSSVSVVAQNSGYATITVRLDNGNSAQCAVNVKTVDVSSASVSPSTKMLDIDESSSLSLSVYPSNATITSRSWKSKNSGVAYVSPSGTVTGVSEGSTEIYCVVNGSVTSSSCKVTVSKPNFTLSSSSPLNNATNQTVFTQPSLTFCRTIYEGTDFSKVSLKDGEGTDIEGLVSISGNSLVFAPSTPLRPNASYTFSVPESAVKDKYGSTNSAVICTFSTGNLQKLTISTSTKERFLSKGEKILLKSDGKNVSIYYTLDGSTPTDQSTKYQQAIILSNDIKLRAIAMGAGYENSDILSQDYFVSNVDIVKKFPNADTKMFEYKHVNPYITFSNNIVASTNVGEVKVKKNGTEDVAGEVIVADSSIFFVPQQPLDLGCYYHVYVPDNAVKTWLGEENHEASWSFCTGNYVNQITMGGPELAMAAKTDGTFLTWGMRYQSGNAADGSCTMTSQLTPSSFLDAEFRSASSGFMHHAIVKNDGSLWMWGRQYCGEFGNNDIEGSEKPIKVMDDVSTVSCGGQTTAIVKNDGSLWMCGRNDFGQIGDSSYVNHRVPIKIMEDVYSATAGWCVAYAIKRDGTLWAWGRNDKHLLGNGTTEDRCVPIKVMDNVSVVAASATESEWAAAIKTDGTLWVWGEKQPSPTQVLENVSSVAVGADYVVAVRSDGSLWALGENNFGQFGNATTKASNSPLKVMDDVSKVASGYQTTMVVMQNGSVWTWGRNVTGLLGDGSTPSLTAYNSKPTEVIAGRSSSLLAGIASRKKTYRMTVGSLNVIDAMPVPMNGIYKELTWSSLNDGIVSVSERGVIKAKSLGEADVVATIKNEKGSEFSINCHVIVAASTGIDDVSNDYNHVNMWTDNRLLYIKGLKIGQTIYVYGVDGGLVLRRLANSDFLTMPIDSGVYIIRIGKFVKKILVR